MPEISRFQLRRALENETISRWKSDAQRMDVFSASQWLRLKVSSARLALLLLLLVCFGQPVSAQCPHSVPGQLKGCTKCGRFWLEQDEPFILYSDEASPIRRPLMMQGAVPNSAPVVRQLSGAEFTGHTGVPRTISQPSFGALEPLQTPNLDPERWLAQQSVSPQNAAAAPQPGEWYESVLAEPDDGPERLSFRSDLSHSWLRFKSDVVGVLQPSNLLLLGFAGANAAVIRHNWDDDVRASTAQHPERWGNLTEGLGYVGEIGVQVPVLAGVYLWSLKSQDEDLHDLMSTTLSAYTINGLTTLGLKAAFNTSRPRNDVSNGHYGFPSFHTSSTFTMASVLNEYYGWQVGVPSFVVAGLVGWSRIDERHHDLSDVVFGAALGYVIGTSVARHHLTGDSRVMLLPWSEPTHRAVGLAMEWRY